MAATFTGAYRDAGYPLRNPRNQWSSVKDDKSGVALTIWADEIDKSFEPWVVDCRDHPDIGDWSRRTGNKIRAGHIAFALSALGGRFDLILCRAKDPSAKVRSIKEATFWDKRIGVMAKEDFDSDTGAFRIELRPRD